MSPYKKKFSDLEINRLYIHHWQSSDGVYHDLVFAPIPPVPGSMECGSCHSYAWNATNLGGNIHFCPSTELQVLDTPYTITDTRQ